MCAEFIEKGEVEFKKISGMSQIEEISQDESANSENEIKLPDFDAMPIKYMISQNKFSTPTKIRKTVIIEDDEEIKNPFLSVQTQ